MSERFPMPPAISVIVITPSGYTPIRTVIGHLHTQAVKAQMEIVIVAPDATGIALDMPALQGFWGVRVVPFADVAAHTAAARAAGVRAAEAEIVAFVEDHAFPQPGWAEALIAAHRRGWAAVGPAVGNANPGSAVSWANLLIEYAPWLEPVASAVVPHLPGHNSSYKRSLLLAYGAALEHWLESESILHWDLGATGHRLYLEAAARTLHTNFSGLWVSMSLRLHGGRLFAASRARHWGMMRRLAYAAAAPLIPFVRARRILRAARPQLGRSAPVQRVLPAVLLLLVCDAAGESAGYLFGAGAVAARAGAFEFHADRCRGQAAQQVRSDAE